MGLLVEGKWQDKWYDTKASKGHFKRQDAIFRNWLTQDGSAGPTGRDGFKAESGRYHLYVSLACPWAHRTLIFRHIKDLEQHISVSVVHWGMYEQGWTFEQDDAAKGDDLFQSQFMHQIYTRAKQDYTGRVTVPVLWDKQKNTIVSNESSEIIRMFNSAFNDITGHKQDLYPKAHRQDIDAINEGIYHNINNGVYKAGFATTQAAYEQSVKEVFAELDRVDARLATHRYLMGDVITEADWRLFTTLVRFDPVYVGHFKCNLRRISDYPNLSGYLRELYQQAGIASTVNMTHIKNHYYGSHKTINPTGVIPLGPVMNLETPHGRDTL